MLIVARVIGTSVVVGVLAATVGAALLGLPGDAGFVMLVLGCTGALTGAVAAAAREVVAAQQQKAAG